MLLTGDLVTGVLFALVCIFVVAFVLWAPQVLVVFAATTYAKERRRIRQSQERTPNPPPDTQSEPPPVGSTSGPLVQ